jgi:alanine racemase
MSRPTQATINLSALRDNLQFAKSLAPQSKTIAVVKANAYGHGLAVVGNALAAEADALAVACIEEALVLRDAGVTLPILLLEGAFEADEIAIATQKNFWLMLACPEAIESVLSTPTQTPLTVWLKIDSGMHRLGIQPEILPISYQRLLDCQHVDNTIVLATHFSCADELDNPSTPEQITLFKKAAAELNAPQSLANSAGLLAWPDAHADWNRPGYMLYGDSPFTHPHPHGDKLKPAMTLKSGIISLRDVSVGESVGYSNRWIASRPSRIATVAIGYGDGYPSHAKNGTPVLINGQRAPLAGRVSMDMITVDVTELEGVTVGDEVILWNEQLTVGEVAACAGTIGYELLAGMPARVPRRIINT